MTLILLTVAAQGADLASFGVGVARRGIGVEQNPVIVAAFTGGGFGGVIAMKVVAAAVLACLAYRMRRTRVRLVPASLGLLGAWSVVL